MVYILHDEADLNSTFTCSSMSLAIVTRLQPTQRKEHSISLKGHSRVCAGTPLRLNVRPHSQGHGTTFSGHISSCKGSLWALMISPQSSLGQVTERNPQHVLWFASSRPPLQYKGSIVGTDFSTWLTRQWREKENKKNKVKAEKQFSSFCLSSSRKTWWIILSKTSLLSSTPERVTAVPTWRTVTTTKLNEKSNDLFGFHGRISKYRRKRWQKRVKKSRVKS
jgi:inorganic triphosphatase YgiF